MDNEQLKMVLETLNAAGDGAITVLVWWLVKDLVVRFLVCACFVFLITMAYRIGVKAIEDNGLAPMIRKECEERGVPQYWRMSPEERLQFLLKEQGGKRN